MYKGGQPCRAASGAPTTRSTSPTTTKNGAYRNKTPKALFELLILEGFQAGLSWLTVLKKRERFRQVLFNFDAERLAQLSDTEIEALMQDAGIIRNRAKLQATRQNARAWLNLPDPAGLLWSFVGGTPKINHFTGSKDLPATSPEAKAMSRALKKTGFNFVGPTICYAFMQACGMMMDHTVDCDWYRGLTA